MTSFSANASKYIPSLDGLRAISILLVIVSHFGMGHIIPGGFGVTVFFFISGFIITRLLIAEYEANRSILLQRFYIRRFLRLMPALFVYIAISTTFVYLAFGKFNSLELLSALFYGANYYNIFIRYEEPAPYRILWSLAIEEHYYIIYPLLAAALFRDYRKALITLVAFVCVVLVWRIYLVYGLDLPKNEHVRVYMGSDTRADSIIFGVLLAILLMWEKGGYLRRLFSNQIVIVGCLSLLLFAFVYRDPFFRQTFRYSLQGIALMPLIFSIVFVPRLANVRTLLEHPWMIYIGKLSYSLYLYHWLARICADWAVSRFDLSWLPVAIGITVVGSVFSYHVIERRMLRLRRAFGSHAS